MGAPHFGPCINWDQLERQRAFCRKTMGPGTRKAAIIAHIEKELVEIADASDEEVLEEWIDVAIMAFDGAMRSGATPLQAIQMFKDKWAKVEKRSFPDWRTVPEGTPIEHIRESS